MGDTQITTAQVASLAEYVRDVMGLTLVAGDNIALTVNDAGDTIVVSGTGGSGGGVSGGKRYWTRNTAQDSSGTVPTTDALVPTMTLTIPQSTLARVAFLGMSLLFAGAHTNRFSFYLDGVKVWPTANNANANQITDAWYDLDVTGIPVVLAPDAPHTIEVRWNASGSTAAITWNDRYLFADVYDGAATSPLPIGGGPQGEIGPLPFLPPVDWAMSTAYVTGPPASSVVYQGETYVAIVSHTSTSEFDPTKWIKIAQKGVSGNDTGADHIVGVGVSKITVATALPATVGPAGDMVVLR
jgi:hypothetical protein